MSREIKLRAWCEDFGEFKMCYYEYNACDNGLWFDMVENFHSSEVHHVMQWTGLRDKKAKEIYEGDLIQDGDSIRRVVFSNQNAAFYMSSIVSGRHFYKEFIECGQSQSDGPVHCDSIEVIGNIYEHPHLLTK